MQTKKLNKPQLLVTIAAVVCVVAFGQIFVKVQRPYLWVSNSTAYMRAISRSKDLNSMCKKLGLLGQYIYNSQKSNFEHIIVNDKYKVMYCYVPKVACTNFLRIFISLSDNIHVNHSTFLKGNEVHILKKNLTHLGQFSRKEIEFRLKLYRKVIFVREPLERVLSAYRNKFILSNNPFFIRYLREKIMPKFKKISNRTITFTEFVQFLFHWETIMQGYNEHWDTFNNLCHPCLIQYNFIGKYESFEEDVDGFLKLLNIEEKYQFPKREINYMHSKTVQVMSTFIKEIPPTLFDYLIKVYTEDYVLFDYKIPLYDSLMKLF